MFIFFLRLAKIHQWVILLSSTELCYYSCYRPYVIFQIAIFLSIFLSICYLPHSYVIVHVIIQMLSSTQLCYNPGYRPYVFFQTAIFIYLFIIVHAIVHKLSYKQLFYPPCYCPCGGILWPMLSLMWWYSYTLCEVVFIDTFWGGILTHHMRRNS